MALKLLKWPLLAAVYVGAMCGYGSRWLEPGLPVGDMGGLVAGLAHWLELLTRGELFSAWSDAWFCGHSRALVNLNGGMELAYVPFLWAGDELAAVRLGALTYMGLSGLSAFVLVRYLLRNEPVAFLMGFAYAFHPVHLSVAAGTSHANFPPYYFLEPLLVWRAFRVLDRPGKPQMASLALIAALTGWVDFERLVLLAPWVGLMLLAALVWRKVRCLRLNRDGRERVRRPLTHLAGAAALTLALLAVVLLPVVCEKSAQALFSESVREASVGFFSIQNPLYYLDRNGEFLAEVYKQLPPANAHDKGTFYMGAVLLSLAGLGVVLRPPVRRERMLLVVILLAGALSLASAHGPFGGYESLCKILDVILLHEEARGAAAGQLIGLTLAVLGVLAGCLLVAWWEARRRGRAVLPALLIAVGVAACLLFAKPFGWVFRRVAPYGEMRNPGWFATAMPALAVVLAAGFGTKCLLKRLRRPAGRALALTAVAGLMVWDVWPYREAFRHCAPDRMVAELRQIGSLLKADDPAGRVLTRESYNPHADLLYAYSHRPAGFYWLNWMAAPHLSSLMLDSVYRTLHRPESIAESLSLAGWAGVRYVVYDLKEGPPPPDTRHLTPKYSGEFFAVYENGLYRPYAGLLAPDALERSGEMVPAADSAGEIKRVVRPGSGVMEVSVEVVRPAVLVVSESWSPGWRAWVDGAPAAAKRVQRAFLGVAVSPGSHVVRFSYPAPWYFRAGLAVTATAGLCCLGLLAGAWLGPACRALRRGPGRRC